jgi:hypothetical protein
MKWFAIAVIVWVCLVPSLVGSFLILAFLAALLPPLYFTLVWLAFGLTGLALLCGPFCLVSLARPEPEHRSSLYQNPTYSEEMEHEHHFAGTIRS